MALEGLSSIEGDLIIGPSYQLINLAQLGSVVRIGGDLRVEGNWRLRGLFMGRLAHLGGELIVEDNSGLVALVFPSLVESGKVRIVRNGSLERVDLSSLESAGPKGTVSGASLEEVKAPLRIQRLTEDAAENAAKGS